MSHTHLYHKFPKEASSSESFGGSPTQHSRLSTILPQSTLSSSTEDTEQMSRDKKSKHEKMHPTFLTMSFWLLFLIFKSLIYLELIFVGKAGIQRHLFLTFSPASLTQQSVLLPQADLLPPHPAMLYTRVLLSLALIPCHWLVSDSPTASLLSTNFTGLTTPDFLQGKSHSVFLLQKCVGYSSSFINCTNFQEDPCRHSAWNDIESVGHFKETQLFPQ